MDLPVAGPSNRFLVAQRDRRWFRALAAILLFSTAVVGALLLVGWPRLAATSVNYELLRLRAEVEDLDRRHRELELEVQRLSSPAALVVRAADLGLEPPRESGGGTAGEAP